MVVSQKKSRVHPIVGLAVIALVVAVSAYMYHLNERNYTENARVTLCEGMLTMLAEQLRERQRRGEEVPETIPELTVHLDEKLNLKGTYSLQLAGAAPDYNGTMLSMETSSGRSTLVLTVQNLEAGQWTVEKPRPYQWWEVWR